LARDRRFRKVLKNIALSKTKDRHDPDPAIQFNSFSEHRFLPGRDSRDRERRRPES
jgi:hypothetical protein